MDKKKNSEIKLPWYKKIVLELLWGTCRILHYTPRWFRYGIMQPFIYAILRLVKYRNKVILENLFASFPEKSDKEIHQIANKYYNILAEVIVNTICLAGVNRKRNADILVWTNHKEVVDKVAGTDWIATGAHYGCWEYLPTWAWYDPESTFMSVYHPLSSDIFECFYRRLRNFASNIEQLPMRDAIPYYLRNRNKKKLMLGLISDQSPALRPDTAWHKFLNQDTAFIDGSEKLALKFHLPVFFAYIKRRAAGRYEAEFIQIYDGHENVAPNEITHRYAEMLEKMILERPELWMWSHRRWKHTPKKQQALFGTVGEFIPKTKQK